MLSPLNTRHRNGLASCLTDAHFFVYLSTEQAKRTASEKEQRATTREKTRVQHRKSENRKRKELNCLLLLPKQGRPKQINIVMCTHMYMTQVNVKFNFLLNA